MKKALCIKPWEGSGEQMEIAAFSVSPVLGTAFYITARAAHVYDGETGNAPKDDDFAKVCTGIVDENDWSYLSYEELGAALKMVFDSMPQNYREGIAESDAHLHKTEFINHEEQTTKTSISSNIKILEPVRN